VVCLGVHRGRGRVGRGVDAVGRRVFRDTDNDGLIDGGDAGPSGFYYLTDVMFSVRAITDSAGLLHTRLDYTPYGVAMHGLAADVNGDGSVNTADLGVVSANYNGGNELQPGDTGYDPDAFLDGSETIVVSDYTGRYSPYVSGGSGPTFNAGWIDNPGDANGPDNSVGYDGYWFDLAGATEATSTGLYIVRHRVYDPRLGRWLQRDPLRYVDSSNMFLYAISSPVIAADPSGMRCTVFFKCKLTGETLVDDGDEKRCEYTCTEGPIGNGCNGRVPSLGGTLGCDDLPGPPIKIETELYVKPNQQCDAEFSTKRVYEDSFPFGDCSRAECRSKCDQGEDIGESICKAIKSPVGKWLCDAAWNGGETACKDLCDAFCKRR